MSENTDNENKNIVQDNDIEDINVNEIEERYSMMSGSVFDPTANFVNSKPVENQEKQENEPLQLYVSSDGKRMRNNGPGELVAICEKMNKDQLIQEVIKKNQMLDIATQKATTTSWSPEEVMMYNNIFLNRNYTGYPEYAKYYNNNFESEPRSIAEIEAIIAMIPPALKYCNANHGTNKFVTLAHQPGTYNILQEFYPYYRFSVMNVLINKDDKLAGIQLTMRSTICPKLVYYYYGAPGTTQYSGDFAKAEDKNRQTYAEKFSGSFKCLKTYNFINDNTVYERLQNLLEVINLYKAKFGSISKSHKFVFDLIIDQIAYFYIEAGLLPKVNEFTLENLTAALPIQYVYDNFCYTTEQKIKCKVAPNPILATRAEYPLDYLTGSTLINMEVARLVSERKLPQGFEAVKNMKMIKNDRPRLIFSERLEDERKHLLASSPVQKMIESARPVNETVNIPNNITNEDVQKVLNVKVQGVNDMITKENTQRQTTNEKVLSNFNL